MHLMDSRAGDRPDKHHWQLARCVLLPPAVAAIPFLSSVLSHLFHSATMQLLRLVRIRQCSFFSCFKQTMAKRLDNCIGQHTVSCITGQYCIRRNDCQKLQTVKSGKPMYSELITVSQVYSLRNTCMRHAMPRKAHMLKPCKPCNCPLLKSSSSDLSFTSVHAWTHSQQHLLSSWTLSYY